jgi:tetratricopeptide (TPR) repeat protein
VTPTGAGRILEAARPLSESALWSVQGDYFRRSGVQAWSSGDVPHTLTSGPIVARAYAQVVEGFLADCSAGRLGALDPTEPIYVVELGAGTGRLALHLLRALDEEALAPLRVVYVLTDMAEANLEFWRSHPRLAPLFASGRLDLARFDAASDGEITLERSGVVLRPGEVVNPLVAVANYLFDVIPQDLFALANGKLHEELISLVADEADLSPDSPDFLRRVWVATTPAPVAEDRYAEPELTSVLEAVALERGALGDERFLFPAPALRCLAHLGALSGDRLLVLVGERPGGLSQGALPGSPSTDGAGPSEAYRPGALLGLSVHGGSFSLPVDMDVLRTYAESHRGTMLLPTANPAGLLVAAIALGANGELPATVHRFAQAVDDGGPEDVFLAMRPALGGATEKLPLAVLLALLRVGGYDAYLFRTLHPAFARQLADAEPAGIEEAVRVFDQVWERYFAIEDDTDVAFGIAALLAPAGRYEEALTYLERSREHGGPKPLVAFNTALCHVLLGNRASAYAAVDEALALDPDLVQAHALRAQLEAGER